ncbi:unnamed protein product [Oppiella nova]|uniref:PH domain-containing protein n=1 Tax=Oppiella nova TaxID=334625 RepID=A0A7R9QIU7_9ACAR|nr:unnamed protein product [Oppiella nova]CAG2166614.1 unnamed protein product [Oppiella nova]
MIGSGQVGHKQLNIINRHCLCQPSAIPNSWSRALQHISAKRGKPEHMLTLIAKSVCQKFGGSGDCDGRCGTRAQHTSHNKRTADSTPLSMHIKFSVSLNTTLLMALMCARHPTPSVGSVFVFEDIIEDERVNKYLNRFSQNRTKREAGQECGCPPVVAAFSLIIVKYLSEVIPYFRKASILADIGWTFNGEEFLQNANQMNSDFNNSTQHKSDTKTVPLLLCHLTKCSDNKSNESKHEDSVNVIAIYSPNRQSKCVLRCVDSAQCSAWFSAIHSASCHLMAQAVIQTNNLLTDFLDGVRLTHMGWLYERSPDVSSHIKWNPVFLAVTERDLLFYDLVPWTREAWAVPVHTFPLLHIRLVHNNSSNLGLTMSSKSTNSGGALIIPGVTDVITFTLRLGTRLGIDCRTMRAESHRDLANWAKHIVQASYKTAIALKEICFGEDHNVESIITVHIDSGFTLEEMQSRNILWKMPFEQLKGTADDGKRLVWLEFNGDDDKLSAKLTHLGLTLDV